jgi:Ca-activated chloride channel family protein
MRLATLLPFLFFASACGHAPSKQTVAAGGAPLAGDPGLIRMDAENTATLVLAETPAQLAVRIRVTAGDLPAGGRPPLNLTLALDTSGSMEGDAIDELRLAARRLIGEMDDRDTVSVVIFHAIGEVLVPPSRLGDTRADIEKRIDGLEARGTTAMAEGLALALQQSQLGHTAETIDRIVLLGDGVPNDASTIPALIQQARGQRVTITALGLGIEFDPILLAQIATETGGIYHYIDSPDMVAAVFDKELTRMQQVVARNLQLQIRPGPGVTIATIPGVAAAGPVQWAMLGDLAAGEHRDVVVPIEITGRRDGASVELIDAVLTYDDAVNNSGPQQRTTYSAVHSSDDTDAVTKSVTTQIAIALERTKAAGAILQAITQARAGDVAGATAILDAAEPAARAVDDAECHDLADQMAELRPHLAELVQQLVVQDYPGAAAMPESVLKAHDKATQTLDGRY